MEHRLAQNQTLKSDLTELSSSQQAPVLSFQLGVEVGVLCSEPKESLVDQAAGTSREVPDGGKRRGRIPTQTPEEKRIKKIEADRNYRKNHRDQFEKLMAIASRFGGVEKLEHEINHMEAELQRLRGIEQDLSMLRQKESEFQRLEKMKYKFGGIEQIESKLHRFNQIASMLGGTGEILPEINTLKNLESQRITNEQMGFSLNQNAVPFSGFLQQKEYPGTQSVNFNDQVQESRIDWFEDYQISEMFLAAESETMHALETNNDGY